MNFEIWCDIVGYEGLYQVSNLGRVRSLNRIDSNKRHWSERIMKLKELPKGYLLVVLCQDGEEKTYYVHRLVLEAFVGPCPLGMECRHFPDRDPANNRLENLQWGTGKDNAADRVVHGTHNKGEYHEMAKLTESQVFIIRKAHETQREIAERFDISQTHVSRIKRGLRWKHI